ncbi:thioredoxin family protein [Elioraea sp.]|uniref:thioredoxin family protein n=1 Tax=Elioraea sp. TaxID=2185103 RepID=UPI0025BC6985|nr:thioredoxin family protein [Elioraea sp.]
MTLADVDTIRPGSGAPALIAPDFLLAATDGRSLRLADIAGPRGTAIVFMCNHCPYVKAVLDLMIRDARDLAAIGVGFAGICSNDGDAYPEDGFAAMQRLARDAGLPFPYLHDPSQDIARAYGAVCTPDFFGFDASARLAYRGRLDASRTAVVPGARRELFEAMKAVAAGKPIPAPQHASIGCSIKWKRG